MRTHTLHINDGVLLARSGHPAAGEEAIDNDATRRLLHLESFIRKIKRPGGDTASTVVPRFFRHQCSIRHFVRFSRLMRPISWYWFRNFVSIDPGTIRWQPPPNKELVGAMPRKIGTFCPSHTRSITEKKNSSLAKHVV